MVTPPHVPVPFSPTLEDLYIPSGAQIADAVRRTLEGREALMAAGITPIVMPKWGLSMKEGTVIGVAGRRGRATSRSARRSSRSRPTRSRTPSRRPTPALLRRKVASEGDLLPVKALLGVMADDDVSDADIDAYIAAYVTPADDGDDEAEAGPAYQFIEVDGIRVRYSRKGADRPASRCCSSTASAATSTTGCSTSTRWPRSCR